MDANDGNLYFSVMRSAASHRGRAREAPAIPAFFLYGDPPRPPEEGTVHIETIAARSALHDWAIAAHRHQELHQLLVIDRGRIDLRLDDHRDVLKGPAIVVVPPGTVHAFDFQENTAGLVVSFAAGLARALACAAAGPDPEPLDRDPPAPRVRPIGIRTRRRHARSPGRAARQRSAGRPTRAR